MSRLRGLAGLAELLQRVTPKQALVHGIPKGSHPSDIFPLATAATAGKKPGHIARSLEFIAYAKDLFPIMFDVDAYPDAALRLQCPEDLIQQLTPIWPVFAQVGWLATVSTSSAIKDQQTNEWLKPPEGFHVCVLATGGIARFRDIARVRLWLAGTGWCKLASPNTHTGVSAVLERCVIDLTVFSPERLDYVAGAIIAKNAPFYQDKPPPELHAGAVLDLDVLPDVTDEEHQQYQALVHAERTRVTPERVAKVRDHIQRTIPTMPETEVEQEIAARLVRTDNGILTPDHPLFFVRGAKVTAGTVTAALDSQRLADPIEPDYRDGSDAVFHWNRGSGVL